eukprot:10163043-Lingulodinium_polyedra.AAC.1
MALAWRQHGSIGALAWHCRDVGTTLAWHSHGGLRRPRLVRQPRLAQGRATSFGPWHDGLHRQPAGSPAC